jgi:hypothetical protein
MPCSDSLPVGFQIELGRKAYLSSVILTADRRCVGDCRTECRIEIRPLAERMCIFVHYTHQGLGQDTPEGLGPVSLEGEIHRRDVLGGIIHDYYRQAA